MNRQTPARFIKYITMFTLIVVLIIPFISNCGGGGGSPSPPPTSTKTPTTTPTITPTITPTTTPITDGGLVSGYVTRSNGGAPVPGSSITITGPKAVTITTGNNGFYSAALPAGTYNITARKNGFAESRIQDLVIKNGDVFSNLNLIQFPVFNPDWPVSAPSISISGISDNVFVNGQVFNIRATVSGSNPTRRITARIGNRTSVPDFQVSDSNTLEFTWNSSSIVTPPSNSYLYIVAYDVNYNRTERFIRLLTNPGEETTLQAPTGAYAQTYTFSEDLEEMSIRQHQQLRRTGVKFEPDFMELPGDNKVDLRVVPQNATIFAVLKWNRVTGADGYSIYRSASGGDFHLIGDSTIGSYTNFYDYSPELTPGITYTYKIQAYNMSGFGTAAVTPSVTVLDRFEVVLVSPADGAVNVPTKPLYAWNVISKTGEKQRYRVEVRAYTAGSSIWTSSKFFDDTSILHSGSDLNRNRVYEWDLITCEAVSGWNVALKDYLSYSLASPNENSTSGSHTFTTAP
jgi:hypothetical protein